MKRIKLFENFSSDVIDVKIFGDDDFEELLQVPGQRWFRGSELDMFIKYYDMRGDFYLLTIGEKSYLGQSGGSNTWTFFDSRDAGKSIEDIASETGVSSYEILSKLN